MMKPSMQKLLDIELDMDLLSRTTVGLSDDNELYKKRAEIMPELTLLEEEEVKQTAREIGTIMDGLCEPVSEDASMNSDDIKSTSLEDTVVELVSIDREIKSLEDSIRLEKDRLEKKKAELMVSINEFLHKQ